VACEVGKTKTDDGIGPCQLEATDPQTDLPLEPDLPLETDVIVKMVVGLQISKDEFDDTKKLAFRQGIADAASVGVGKVKIANIEEVTTSRRHLLADDSIKIDVEVAAKDANAAASVASQLTVENINAQLSKANLPEAEVLSAAVVQSPASAPSDPQGKSSSMTIIIAVVCAGVAAVVLGVVVLMYRRSRTLTKAELNADRSTVAMGGESVGASQQPSLMSNDPDTATSGENQRSQTPRENRMPRLANAMRAHQEALADNSGQRAATDQNTAFGEFHPVATDVVNLESVVMNLDGDNPTAPVSPRAAVPVRAYEFIDFSRPAEEVKSTIAEHIKRLNLGNANNVSMTADTGMFMARPIEASSTMPSVATSMFNPASAVSKKIKEAPSAAFLPSSAVRASSPVARAASPVLVPHTPAAALESAIPRAGQAPAGLGGYNTAVPSVSDVLEASKKLTGRSRMIAMMNSTMPPEEDSCDDDEDV